MKRETIEHMKALQADVSGHPALPESARVLLGLLVEAVEEMAVVVEAEEQPAA
jgi:hypothetical protein